LFSAPPGRDFSKEVVEKMGRQVGGGGRKMPGRDKEGGGGGTIASGPNSGG